MLTHLNGPSKRIAVVLVMFAGTLAAGAQYGGGIGTAADPYLIYTPEQMSAIGANPADWGSHFRLMANLDLSGFAETQFPIMGRDYDYRFSGVFDGNGHSISNFACTGGAADYVGLFGYVDGLHAEIRNLGLINPRVTSSGSNVGGLVGYLKGTVTNCYVRGGSVSGRGAVGGLVGENSEGTILNCYSTSAVTGTGNAVGGLVGYHFATRFGITSNCYARGAVDGNDRVGGLVGSNSGPIADCYATGRVVGNDWVGGLVGSGSGKVTGAFWDIESGGRTTDTAGQGITSAQMRDPTTFRAAGWDFFGPADGPSDVWAVDPETGYPILWWQVPPNELPDLPEFAGGAGTPADPFLVGSAQQLNRIGHNPRLMTAHFRLTSDIDLAGAQFFVIGSKLLPFTGDFDGDNRTISNLAFSAPNADVVGLFGRVAGTRAAVRNLILINPNINVQSGSRIGPLVGHLDGGTVRNCRVQGGCVSGGGGVSGLIGANDGTIRDCRVEATVTGNGAIGGLAGSTSGMLANCQVSGTVTGRGSYVGGMTGSCSGIIANCSAGCIVTGGDQTGGAVGFVQVIQGEALINCCVQGGSVSGKSEVGGLIGRLNVGDLWNCYSTCPVSGKDRVGGLVGSVMIGSVLSSFWNVETSGQAVSAAGTGKNAAEMSNPDTFLEAGWDFFGPANGPSDIWTWDSAGHRPVLWWQVPADQWPLLPGFSGGTGTPADPYLIDSPAQLSRIGHNPRLMECSFKLVNDVDLADTEHFPIGGLAAPFRATFDGNDHTISNLTHVDVAAGPVGLLGYVEGADTQVRNLTLLGPRIDAGDPPYGGYAGALAGRLEEGALLNCAVEGGAVSSHWGVGGLAGCIAWGVVRDCHATSAVAGGYQVGGLVGDCDRSVVLGSYAEGTVTASDAIADTGGLVGGAFDVTIRDCHATGAVTGSGWTGGLVGWSHHSAIARCYATGDVSGRNLTGGLVGANDHFVVDCRATGNITGREEVGGLTGENHGVVTNCNASGAVSGQSLIGGLTGSNWNGIISHSHADAVVTGDKDVGGLVGENDQGGLTVDCYATGTVSGQDDVGGLAGHNTCGSTIAGCCARGRVTGQINVGGLAGYNNEYGQIADCYASGSVGGLENVGGLVGCNGMLVDPNDLPPGVPWELPGMIANCYSFGPISGATHVGGLVGFHDCGSVTASFWDKETSGQTASDGGQGKTTAEMQTAATYVAVGWDLEAETGNITNATWWIREGLDYPHLSWEPRPEQP